MSDMAEKLIRDHGKQAFHKTVELATVAQRRGDKKAFEVLKTAAKTMIERGMHKNATRRESAR
jgi:hypothetical protein